ncbi:MAG: hypothetical protein ACRD3S_09005 [Terracidiphilus sp.]
MKEAILVRVREANAKLQTLLSRANDATAGRANLTAEDLREAHGPISQLGPSIGEVVTLRQSMPELDDELNSYSQNLEAAQVALDRVRCVLLARCASMEAQRAHLETVALWSSAWAKTQFASSTLESPEPGR